MVQPWSLLRVTLAAALGLVTTLAGCSGDPASPQDAGPDRDADVDTDAGSDADVDTDAGPTGSHAGQVTDAVLIPGTALPVAMAALPDGGFVVTASQVGTVTVGTLELRAPAGPAIVVIAFAPDGAPRWARTLTGPATLVGHAVAAGPDGDIVIGGVVGGGAFPPGDPDLPGAATAGGDDDEDGFLLHLAGTTGATLWAHRLGSPVNDHVGALAIDADDNLYAYGTLGAAGVLPGGTAEIDDDLGAGAFVARYDRVGTRAWARNLPTTRAGTRGPMVLDPAGGVVVAARFLGPLAVGADVLTVDVADESHTDLLIAGIGADGEVRFARAIADEQVPFAVALAALPGGDLLVAGDTGGGQLVVGEHTIWDRDVTDDLFVLRLGADGVARGSTVIRSDGDDHVRDLTVDATGAVYLAGSCFGAVDVQPTIACPGGGSVIASYGPDDAYRWATLVGGGTIAALVPAGADRLRVVGAATTEAGVDVGDVHLAGAGLFVATLVTGPAAIPSPAPLAPEITSLRVEGLRSPEIRQGGTATLVISGHRLDQVTSARLGDLAVHVPAGTDAELRLPIAIPHGHPPGPLPLCLSNAGGTAKEDAVVRVTPVVVAPDGSDDGDGTYAAPFRLCRARWHSVLERTDVVVLLEGIHRCDDRVSLPRGVTVRSGGVGPPVLRGDAGRFLGLLIGAGFRGTTTIRGITIEDGATAIHLAVGDLVVDGVEIDRAVGPGLVSDGAGRATLTSFFYRDGAGAGIDVRTGTVVAGDVEITSSAAAVLMRGGALQLRRTQATGASAGLRITGPVAAVDLGTAEAPGDNDLDSPAGVALLDERSAAGTPIDAHGTRLGGVALDATVVGPAEAAGRYRILGPNQLRF